MKDKGFIVLYRQFLDWEWFNDINTCHLFLYFLLRANYQDTEWRGITIKKGQFITSYTKLSEETGLTYKQVRLSLDKLKRTGEVAHEGHSSYSVITIKNWSKFQNKGRQMGSQRATDNNITNITNKNINISLSNISKEEREILKNYVLRQRRKPDNVDAYIKALIKNGDYKEIVEKEKRRIERQARKEKMQVIKSAPPVALTPEEEKKIADISAEFWKNKRRG